MPLENLDTELSKLRIHRSKRRRRGRLAQLLLAAILVGGAGSGGYLYYSRANAAIPVTVHQVELKSVDGEGPQGLAVLTAGGYVIPRDKIEISSQIIGRVKAVHVERGDRVKTGEIILEIDDEEYIARVKMAEAQVGTLRAQLAELRAGSRPQEIAAARAEVASAEATKDKAEADLKRLETLAEEKVASRQELDQARQAFEVSRANADSARKHAELVEIGPRREVMEAAEARLREAEANLEFAKTQLAFTIIRAPIDGTILEKVAKEGELVTNTNFGGTRGAKSSVVSMADLSDLQIELDVNEDDLARVKLEQKCEIRLDSHPDRVFNGSVDEIAPQADRQKATVQVKVRFLDPDETVRPEVSARVTFMEEARRAPIEIGEGGGGEPRIFIPRNTIKNDSDGPCVFIASQGTAVRRSIRIGLDGPQGVEVLEGLVGTEKLIVNPTDEITDGVKINAPA